MPRPHGYYWVKFSTEPQLQIVLIQEDGNVWVFGENQPRRVAGDEPASAKALSFEVVAGPLVPPEIPKLQTPDAHASARSNLAD
jgi:hypothetical protein